MHLPSSSLRLSPSTPLLQNRTEETAFEYKEPFSASATPTTHNLSLDENMAGVPQKEGGRGGSGGAGIDVRLRTRNGGWRVGSQASQASSLHGGNQGRISTPPSSLLEIVHSFPYH